MITYIQTATGIIVSIVFFLIGYRQTIGARRERAKAAIISLQRALLRRTVLEDYTPSHSDITILIEGKAKEYQVRSSDLYTSGYYLNALFTAIFDNDLIAPEQRKSIENRIRSAIEANERKKDISAFTSNDETRKKERTQYTSVMLAFVATTLGVTVSLLPQLVRGVYLNSQMLIATVSAVVGSLSAIWYIAVLRRGRESSEEAPPNTSADAAAKFEMEIARILDNIGIQYSTGVRFHGGLQVDYVVEIGQRKIPIEVKMWKKFVPIQILSRTVRFADVLREQMGVPEVLIVVPDTKILPKAVVHTSGVRFLTTDELRTYLMAAR